MRRSSGSVVERPPPAVGGGGGGGSDWIRLFEARDDIEAHLLTGRLAQSGIETRTLAYRGSPSAWLYGASNPWTPVTVFVRRVQLDDARLVLAEISLGDPAEQTPDADAEPTPVVWWLVAASLGVLFAVLSLLGSARAAGICPLAFLCGPP